MTRPWRVLASRVLLDFPPRVTVSAETVELPDGRVVEDFVRIDMPHFVCIFPETDEGRVIALKQYRHGVRGPSLCFPGGHIDRPGESPLETAKRELLEETGCVAQAWTDLGAYAVMANAGGPTAHMFRATGCRKIQEEDSGDLEDTQILELTRDEIREAVRRGDVNIVTQMALIAMVMGEGVMGEGVMGEG